MRLEDQFEWDIRDPFNIPEQFADRYCKDLGLGGEFKYVAAFRALRGVFLSLITHFYSTGLRLPTVSENRSKSTRSPSTSLVTPRTAARSKMKNSVLRSCLPSILPGALWTKSRPTRRCSTSSRRTIWSATSEPTDANEGSPEAAEATKSCSPTGSLSARSARLRLGSPSLRRKPSCPLRPRDALPPSRPKRQTPRLPSSSRRKTSRTGRRPRCRRRCSPPLHNNTLCRA
jgi:hypothetical protein